MNKSLNIVFVVFGVIFVSIVLVGIGYYLSSSFGGTTSDYTKQSGETTPSETEEIESDTSFTLSENQKQALSSFGIDPASVPSSITAEQDACFVAELGSSRVSEIKAGGVPSTIDFLKAKSCL